MTGGVTISRVARLGHPFLFAAAVGAAVLALTLLSFANVHAAAAGGYRLAGIVAVGKGHLGFLELPGGEQILVRQGSAISGGGRIVALDGERLRIAFPDRTIELTLEGSGAVASMTRDILVDQPDEGQVVMRQVDSAAIAHALKTPSGTGKRVDARVAVAQRFASLADLPDNARVLAVNEVPVTSADATIRLAEKSLAEGRAVSLQLATAGGDPGTRVYLMPADH